MDITKKNFNECLPFVLESIKSSSFVAIDGEFTGLDSAIGSACKPFDTPEERYQSLRKYSAEFLLFQFGLCTFHYDKETKKHTARPFNFYLFPRPYSRAAPDSCFSCQSSSMDFLASNGFDFNKVFKEGISYLNVEQENNLRENLQQKHQQFSLFSSPAFTTPDPGAPGVTKGPVSVPQEQKGFIDGVCDKINTFLTETEDSQLNLPSCNGFQRKLIYQVVRSKFEAGIHLETKSSETKERYIVVTRIKSEEDMKTREAAKQQAELSELENAVGFTKVMRMLSQSSKVVVGHNMLLDILHSLHQFFYPLPESYTDFKMMTQCAFPRLVDTKLMASTNPFKEYILNTTLSDLLRTTDCQPFKKTQVDMCKEKEFRLYTSESGQLHEAAFDAYLTGVCFIRMSDFLGTFKKEPCDRVPPGSPLVHPFLNKIYLMRVSDLPYMDLVGPDLIPNREHLFHIEFPKEWNTNDLNNVFSPFGGAQIYWLDDTSALAALHITAEAKKVMPKLGAKRGKYRIRTYQQFKQSPNGITESSSPPSSSSSSDQPASSDSDRDGLQQSSSNKRQATDQEESAPAKKIKSLNVEDETGAPEFVSRCVTPPLADGESAAENGFKTPQTSSENGKPSYAQVTAKKTPASQTKCVKEEKMFTEPETW